VKEIEGEFSVALNDFTQRLQAFKSNGIALWRDLSTWLGKLSIERKNQVKRRWKGLLPSTRIDILAMHGRGECPDYLALEAEIRVHPTVIRRLDADAARKIQNPEYNIEILSSHGSPKIKKLSELNAVEFRQVIDEFGHLLERAEQQAKRVLPVQGKKKRDEHASVVRNCQRISGQLVKLEAWPDGEKENVTVIHARIADLRKWIA